MHRPKIAENYYESLQNNGTTYEEAHVYSNPANELGISSLDLAAFTVNSSVYKNRERRTVDTIDKPLEPMCYVDAVGKESLKLSRRMRWLVVMNAVLSVLTLFCLGLTSFVCYKVIIKGERCKACEDSHTNGMLFLYSIHFHFINFYIFYISFFPGFNTYLLVLKTIRVNHSVKTRHTSRRKRRNLAGHSIVYVYIRDICITLRTYTRTLDVHNLWSLVRYRVSWLA